MFLRMIKLLFALGLCALSSPNPVDTLLAQRADGRSVSPELFLQLEEGACLVDIAYCIGTGPYMGISKPFNCLSRCSDFPDFELIKTWNTGVMLSDSCGYIALDHGKQRLIVSFRGSHSIANAIADLYTVPQEYVPYPGSDDPDEPRCDDCCVHSGFAQSWIIARKQIMPEIEDAKQQYPDYQVHVLGHSLGGAVATLASLDFLARGFDPIVTTYGEPRIGNKGFIKYLDHRFNLTGPRAPSDKNQLRFRRVTHVDDPVPQLPPSEWGFVMHAGEIFISKASLTPEVSDVIHCDGDLDQNCIAGQDPSTIDFELAERNVERRGFFDLKNPPSRFKLWNMLSAHRDYFWRVGLCVPGSDLFAPAGDLFASAMGSGYDYLRDQQ